jgi:hypothetical protein
MAKWQFIQPLTRMSRWLSFSKILNGKIGKKKRSFGVHDADVMYSRRRNLRSGAEVDITLYALFGRKIKMKSTMELGLLTPLNWYEWGVMVAIFALLIVVGVCLFHAFKFFLKRGENEILRIVWSALG